MSKGAKRMLPTERLRVAGVAAAGFEAIRATVELASASRATPRARGEQRTGSRPLGLMDLPVTDLPVTDLPVNWKRRRGAASLKGYGLPCQADPTSG
jgi:hypothetical protein